MKKKLLMRLAAAALAVGMCLSSAGASYFTDVSPNSWYYGAAMECASYGLMNGYDDGSFRPNANVTRAECAQILSNINPEWRAEIIYYDVDSSKWYRNVVSHYGTYMGGTYTDTKHTTPFAYREYFYPNRACTREDFVYGVGNVIGISTDNNYSYFDDWASINPNYVDVINAMRMYGIVNGDGTGMHGKFNPKKTITRAEVAQILCNLIEVAEN